MRRIELVSLAGKPRNSLKWLLVACLLGLLLGILIGERQERLKNGLSPVPEADLQTAKPSLVPKADSQAPASRDIPAATTQTSSSTLIPETAAQVNEEGSWPMAGANLERTSWTAEEVRGELQPVWYKPFEPYISQKVQIIAAYQTLYIATARGLYASTPRAALNAGSTPPICP